MNKKDINNSITSTKLGNPTYVWQSGQERRLALVEENLAKISAKNIIDVHFVQHHRAIISQWIKAHRFEFNTPTLNVDPPVKTVLIQINTQYTVKTSRGKK